MNVPAKIPLTGGVLLGVLLVTQIVVNALTLGPMRRKKSAAEAG